MEIQGARHGQLWRAANLRQRLDLPCVCGQDRGTAARRAAGRDGAAQGPRRRGLSPDPHHPHQRGDVLSELLDQQGKALQSFLRDRKVKEVFKEMGHVGQVRALEVTHGRKAARNNGWHPHFHILQFCYQKGNETDRKDWAARLYVRWAFYCEKSGLGTPSYAHGIKLDNGEKASDYVTKWGLEDEMTKGHTKKAKAGGETPFDLLRAAMADRQDKQAMALFRVRGVLQGQTSVVLVKQSQGPVFVDEKTDQELAAEKDDRAVLLGLLTVDQWRDVLKVDGRGVLLDIAAKGGWHNVQRYLWLIEGAREGVQIDPEILTEARQLLTS